MPVEAIGAAEILEGLPSRIHEVIDAHVAATPDRVALIEDGSTLTYRELDRGKHELGQIGVGTAEVEVKFDLQGTDHRMTSLAGGGWPRSGLLRILYSSILELSILYEGIFAAARLAC